MCSEPLLAKGHGLAAYPVGNPKTALTQKFCNTTEFYLFWTNINMLWVSTYTRTTSTGLRPASVGTIHVEYTQMHRKLFVTCMKNPAQSAFLMLM